MFMFTIGGASLRDRAHFFEGRTSDVRIRGKREKKEGTMPEKEKAGARRRKRMLLVRIHASVGPARCGRARNIKVSNYNARHDTSFRPSSIKSHETPDGGHRYRVICAPVATDYPLEEMPGRERKGERKRASLLSNILPWASSRHRTIGSINVRSTYQRNFNICNSPRFFYNKKIK